MKDWVDARATPAHKVCGLGSSYTFSGQLIGELWQLKADKSPLTRSPAEETSVGMSDVDTVDGPPNPTMKDCAVMIVGDPVQTHVIPSYQLTVTLPSQEMLDGVGIGAHYRRTGEVFRARTRRQRRRVRADLAAERRRHGRAGGALAGGAGRKSKPRNPTKQRIVDNKNLSDALPSWNARSIAMVGNSHRPMDGAQRRAVCRVPDRHALQQALEAAQMGPGAPGDAAHDRGIGAPAGTRLPRRRHLVRPHHADGAILALVRAVWRLTRKRATARICRPGRRSTAPSAPTATSACFMRPTASRRAITRTSTSTCRR